MSPDDDVTNNNGGNGNVPEQLSDQPLSDLEQAQFDAMRSGSDIPETVPEKTNGAGGEHPTTKKADEVTPPADPKVTPPAEDPDPDLEVVDPKSGQKQKRVSIHKFQRVETRAKELETALETETKRRQEFEERQTRLDERLKIINEALETPAATTTPKEEDTAPDPEKDIFGYAQWQGRQLAAANDRIERLENAGRQGEAERELATTYQSDAARFASTEPAFAAAYVYLIKQRDAELQLAGVTDKKKRDAQIVSEERGLVKGAIDSSLSPAERIYKMAIGRGFNPASVTTQEKPAVGETTTPATAPKDPKALDAPVAATTALPKKAEVSVTAEIEAIQRGQDAAQSLSNVGGGAPPRELTSATLADMPEEEFNDLIARLPKERLMELMGN